MGFEKILRELSGLLVLLTEGWQSFPICTRIAIDSADDFANHNYCISSVLMTLTTKGLQRAVRSWPYYLLLSCRACWRAFCRPSSITFFHPQQLAMLMISEDATIRIWDLETSLSDAMAILFSEVKEIQRGYHKVMMSCDMLEWRLRCKAYGHVYIQRGGLGGLECVGQSPSSCVEFNDCKLLPYEQQRCFLQRVRIIHPPLVAECGTTQATSMLTCHRRVLQWFHIRQVKAMPVEVIDPIQCLSGFVAWSPDATSLVLLVSKKFRSSKVEMLRFDFDDTIWILPCAWHFLLISAWMKASIKTESFPAICCQLKSALSQGPRQKIFTLACSQRSVDSVGQSHCRLPGTCFRVSLWHYELSSRIIPYMNDERGWEGYIMGQGGKHSSVDTDHCGFISRGKGSSRNSPLQRGYGQVCTGSRTDQREGGTCRWNCGSDRWNL